VRQWSGRAAVPIEKVLKQRLEPSAMPTVSVQSIFQCTRDRHADVGILPLDPKEDPRFPAIHAHQNSPHLPRMPNRMLAAFIAAVAMTVFAITCHVEEATQGAAFAG
jgi:hypothetical protein